jgi:hypothetical protein
MKGELPGVTDGRIPGRGGIGDVEQVEADVSVRTAQMHPWLDRDTRDVALFLSFVLR